MLSRVWSRFLVRSYLKALRALLSPPLGKLVSKTVLEKLPSTMEEEISLLGAEEKQYALLSFCAVVLHADNAIREHVKDEAAASDIPLAVPAHRQHVFAQAMNNMPLSRLNDSMAGCQLRMAGKTAEAQLRGGGFFSPKGVQNAERTYVGLISAKSSQQSYPAMIVTRCGFYEFFVRHKRPELATVMCLGDTKGWMRILAEHPRSRIHCRRPSTISTGGSQCIFELVAKKEDELVVDIEYIVPPFLLQCCD